MDPILRSFQDAVIVRNVVAKSLKAFAKYHPILTTVERAAKIIEKNYQSALRFSEIASKHDSAYHGDRSKIQPNMDKAIKSIELILSTAGSIEEPVVAFRDELQHTSGSNLNDQLTKWVTWFVSSLKEARGEDFRAMRPSSLNDFAERELGTLIGSVKNLSVIVRMTSKVQEAGPEYEDTASDADKFKAYQTSQVTSMAKSCAKKLGNEAAPCITLGLGVLEDVNADSALRLLNNTIGHYEKTVSDEDLKLLRPLVGKVSTAIDFGVVEAGAFLCAIMQIVRAPETSRVFAELTKYYSEYM